MASSRRSSGSNSSNSQKGSQESKSSSSETEIILDLGVTNDIDEAEKKVKDWITDNLKKIKITGEWRPIWGIKFTKGITTDFSKSDGIQNLGKVIGQEYFVVGMRLTDGETTLASYRIDWDKIKGKHFNPEIPKIFPRQSFAYKFGNLDEDKIIDPETNKAPGEVEIINRMLVFTKMALQNNQLMSPLQAQLILSNFRIQSQSNRAYFRNFAELLRPLIEASLLAISSSEEFKNQEAYKFNSAHLSSLISVDMREIWSTPVTLFLDDIDSENKLPEEPLDPEAAQTLLSELNYAGGGHEHSETVLASLNDFFISKKVNSIQLLMSHLETFASSGEINNMRLAFNKINISTEIKPEHKQTSNSSTHILKELMKSNSGAKEALPHTPAATPLSHISAPVSGNKSEMKPIDITDVTPINNPNERPRMGR